MLVSAADNRWTRELTNITYRLPSDLDLDVYLTGLNSAVVQLFNLSSDNNVSNFDGISATDALCTIEVFDNRKKTTGTLNGWSKTVD